MIKIAIADDQPVYREGLRSLLTKMGYEVVLEAENGTDLLDKLRHASHLPDICLMDISMPGMDGFETTEAMKVHWPEIDVLVMTVHAEDLYFVRMLHCGANGYLTKDAKASQIRDAIERILHTGRHFSEKQMELYSAAMRNGEVAPPKLSATEIEVIRLCCAEYTTKEIAGMICDGREKAIENMKAAVYRKLGVKTLAGLALAAVRYGYVQAKVGPSPFRKAS
ncbi:MAG: response regulator transcription factor [Taibaiella sp.]|nr:response regulator transcription factor [Taibaiella sp.]